MSAYSSSETTVRTNPFPGLRPFEPEEAHLFFGREGQSDELLRRLHKTRFLAVVGTSGSGKSSLIRAGLLPALHAGYMVEEGSHWRIALMRPGHDPIGSLAQQLQHVQPQNAEKATGHDDDNQEDQAIKQALLEATLRRSARGLIETAQYIQLGPHENLMVMVDQFEELFRFQKDMKGGKEEAAAFVKLLLEAAEQRDVPIFIVLTMRSDFLGDCAQFRDLPEAFNAGQYLIPRMTRDQHRVSITGPVAVAGGAITPRLVQTLLNTVGDDPDQLPILQHALMRAWDHWETTRKNGVPIDLENYQKVGEFNQALSRHADEAYNHLPTDRAKTIAEKIFKCLTEKGRDNRETRRPTKLETLREVAGVTTEEVIEVINQFRSEDCTFLMPPQPMVLTDDTLIDISHESLIRKWTRLQKWVEEEADSRATYLRLVDAAQRYENGEGNLWRDPELALALIWQKTQQPNQAWAALYEGKLEVAENFLAKSQEAKAAEQYKRLGMMGLFCVLVLAVFVGLWWGQEQAKRQAERAREAVIHTAASAQVAKDPTLGAVILANLQADHIPYGGIQTAHELATSALASSVFRGHEGRVYTATFSPDGQSVVTASDDQTARVWRADGTGEPVVLTGHEGPVNTATFSPDGQSVVTASDDQTARVWRVGWESLLKNLRDRTTACLSKDQRLKYLFEDEQTAQKKFEACERRYGRLR